jgi:MHS family alpha-ketoglutarate permease-like MFS transporter
MASTTVLNERARPASPETPSRTRAIVAGSVGNAVEWYDWTIYASFAVFFSAKFFPAGNDTVALLNTFLIFALGFFARPLGGWALGVFADRHGRKAALSLSIMMIAGGSLLIAVSPTYAQIGLAAPLILIIARLMQGLSLGGQYAAASTFLTEIAPEGKRGLYASFVFLAAAAGILLASVIGTVLNANLTADQMKDWGWRVPFAIGALGGPIGFWIRSAVQEAHAPARTAGVVHTPLRTLLREHKVALGRILGFAVLSTFGFYVFVPYLPTYAMRAVGAERATAFAANTVAMVVFMVVQPLFGMLSDRFGRKPQLIVFALGYLIFFYPLMVRFGPTFKSLLALELFGLMLYAMYSSIAPAIMAEQFPRSVRAVGIGTPYNLMVALLGGMTPYVLTYLQSIHQERIFFFIVLAGALVSLLTFVQMPETANQPLE